MHRLSKIAKGEKKKFSSSSSLRSNDSPNLQRDAGVGKIFLLSARTLSFFPIEISQSSRTVQRDEERTDR